MLFNTLYTSSLTAFLSLTKFLVHGSSLRLCYPDNISKHISVRISIRTSLPHGEQQEHWQKFQKFRFWFWYRLYLLTNTLMTNLNLSALFIESSKL